jgi:uncharacterized SAM-binding protein YcdF (DUF218 family)
MILPSAEMRKSMREEAITGEPGRSAPPARFRSRSLALGVLTLLVACALAWSLWLYLEIRHYSSIDEARPAGAIVVFGAAEYDGRPSPVLRARLEQALTLYRRGLAPFVITLGGSDGEQHSEGGVGHDFMIAHGIPESQIIGETQSANTEESARRLAAIARENHITSIIAVSDGTHLFRIHALCRSYGLTVFTSPRVVGRPVSAWERARRIGHEMVSYTGWRLGIH